jgi:hypothetical protein
MSENVWVAIIAAVPPTIAACAALWHTRKLSKPIEDVNRAVNHRDPSQKTLIQTVDLIAQDLIELRQGVSNVETRLSRHLAFHQAELEEDEL